MQDPPARGRLGEELEELRARVKELTLENERLRREAPHTSQEPPALPFDPAVLTANAEQLRAVLDAMPVMMDAHDRSGLIVYWNRECERVTGYSSDEVVGNPDARRLFYPDDEYRAWVNQTIEDEQSEFRNVELELTCKDGSTRIISWSKISDHVAIPDWATWTVGVDVTERTRAEEAVEEHLHFLQTLLDVIPSGIFYKATDGIYQGCNRTLCEWLGLSLEEIIGHRASDLYPPELAEKYDKMDRDLFDEPGEQIYEFKIGHADGTTRDVIFQKATYTDSKGKLAGLVGVATDITALKKTETALRTSEERFREVVDHMATGVAVYEVVGDGDDFLFLDINPAGARTGKLSREEHMGRSVREVYPGVEESGLIEVFRRVWRTGEAENHDLTLYHDDQIFLWVDNYVFRLPSGHIVAVYDDVTKRRMAEQALRQSEAILTETGVIARIGGWEHDLRARKAVWTKALYDIVEIEPGAPPGPDEHLDYYPPEDRAILDAAYQRAIETGEPIDLELRCQTATGRPFWGRVLGRPVFVDGTCVRMIGTFQDITSRKEAELERRNLEEKLRQSQKMEAVGQLAGGVAHDFNNQLAAILGFADLLASNLDDEELRGYAQRIARAADNAGALTSQLLAFSRRGQHRRIEVEVNELVRDVIELLRRSIDKRITTRCQLNAQPAKVIGDPAQIQSALLNLGINAGDAMPEGGELEIITDTQVIKSIPSRVSPELKPGAYLTIQVRDTGIGMTEEVRHRAFEPFFTTKKAGEGTGMGLAAVYGTVSRHGGGVLVDSQPGQGSIFTLYLPLAEGEYLVTTEMQPPVQRTRSVRILVVDDEELVRLALCNMLRTLGHEVIDTACGDDAIAAYRSSWQEIDLTILDLTMPGMSGSHVFSVLLEINEEARILVISGHCVEGAAQHLLDRGAVGFLKKPFTLDTLGAAVDSAVGHEPDRTCRRAPQPYRG